MQFNSIPFYWVSKNPNHTFSTNQDANAANPTENLTYSHSRSDVEIYGSRHNNYKSKSNLGRRSRSISESPPTRHYSGRNSRDRQRMRHSRVSSTKYQQCLLLIRTLLSSRIIRRQVVALEFSAWTPTPPSRKCASCLISLGLLNAFKWSLTPT